MDGLVALHLIMLGLWGGLVIVEIIFEIGTVRGFLDAKQMARLHVWTDRFAELPLLSMVLLSGFLLWARAGWSMDFLPKIACGLGAVLMNLVCYVVVERRGAADTVTTADARPVFATAIPGIAFGLTALYLGGARAGWW